MTKLRLGLAFFGDRPLSEQISLAKVAEERGMDTIWLADHYGLREIFVEATAIALATRRVKIGLGVLNPYTRHPAVVAMFSRTFNELVGPRLILGIGAGLRPQKQILGRLLPRPRTAVKEWLHVTRGLLEGERVTFRGETLDVKDLALDFGEDAEVPPLYVGGTGPRMLELAGRECDGVLLSAGVPTGFVRYAWDRVKKALASSGRSPIRFDLAVLAVTSVSSSGEVAKTKVLDWVRTFSSQPFFTTVLRLSNLQRSGRITRSKNLKNFDDGELVSEFAIAGDPDECRARIGEYASAGGRQLVLALMGDHPERQLALLS